MFDDEIHWNDVSSVWREQPQAVVNRPSIAGIEQQLQRMNRLVHL